MYALSPRCDGHMHSSGCRQLATMEKAVQSRGEKRVDIVYMFTDQLQPHRFTTMFVCHHQGSNTRDRTIQRLSQHLDFRIRVLSCSLLLCCWENLNVRYDGQMEKPFLLCMKHFLQLFDFHNCQWKSGYFIPSHIWVSLVHGWLLLVFADSSRSQNEAALVWRRGDCELEIWRWIIDPLDPALFLLASV